MYKMFLISLGLLLSSISHAQSVDPKAKICLAPKINLDATEFPLGTTKIQGKIVVTCSN